MFDNIRLPEDIEKNAEGGPSFKTQVLTLGSGSEKRNEEWSRERRTWKFAYGNQDIPFGQTLAIENFFLARRGKSHGFLFRDWSDYQVIGGSVGTGDGTTLAFQLTKTYVDMIGNVVRKITRPDPTTLVVLVNGAPAAPVLGDLGIITFGAPVPGGSPITASFEFDVPCRFDTDQLMKMIPLVGQASVTDLTIVELIE